MMKFEKYNQLTVEQKEEYNYRFPKKTYFDINNVFAWMFVFVLIFIVMMYTYYLIVSDDAFSQLKDEHAKMLKGITGMVYIVSTTVSMYVLGGAGEIIYRVIKEKNWLKERLKK